MMYGTSYTYSESVSLMFPEISWILSHILSVSCSFMGFIYTNVHIWWVGHPILHILHLRGCKILHRLIGGLSHYL